MNEHEEKKREGRLKLGLWLGFLGPPIAWIVNLQASYTLVVWTCSHGRFFLVHLSSLIFLAAAVVAGFVGHTTARAAARVDQDVTHEGMDEVSPFMGQLALWTSALFALLILAQALPTFVLSPCSE